MKNFADIFFFIKNMVVELYPFDDKGNQQHSQAEINLSMNHILQKMVNTN